MLFFHHLVIKEEIITFTRLKVNIEMALHKPHTLIYPNPLTDETLTCIATWSNESNSSQTFLMAALDDRFRRTQEDRLRCFLLQKTDSDGFTLITGACGVNKSVLHN